MPDLGLASLDVVLSPQPRSLHDVFTGKSSRTEPVSCGGWFSVVLVGFGQWWSIRA